VPNKPQKAAFTFNFTLLLLRHAKIQEWFKFQRPWALKPYPKDLNHCRSCTPASEDGLKESPKHVRKK
jgi:hypothetical protein